MHLSIRVRFLAALLLGAVVTVHDAAAFDAKVFGAGSACTAYGPDTTAGELQFTPTGVYNPGTTTEKVMCLLIHDQEGAYAASDALQVRVDYRVLGATNGRVTCTLYIGTTSQQTEAVYTSTASGSLVNGGNRSYLTVQGGTQQLNYNMVPSSLVCAIPPKTSMGSLYFSEVADTDLIMN